ncbi:MAG: ABC transporter substrate-binding protein [Treponema sp.]|jgi:putative aldouronate transport system substrate-binding protein|nr:ABC transporter substrate-binding protein [Treponema sp.]
MMRRKFVFFAMAGLVLTMALLAGCSGSSGAASSGSGKQRVVFYLISFNKIPESTKAVEDAVNQYIAATYPDANVELGLQIFGPAEYEEKIRLAMQSGTQVDMFTPLGIYNLIAQNQCLPLEDLMQTYGQDMLKIIRTDLGDDAFGVFQREGHTYGVPINKGMVITPTFIYDKDMLAATGYSIDQINSFRDLEPVFSKILQLYPDVFPYAGTNAQDSFIIPLLIGEHEVDVLGDRVNYMGAVFGSSGKVVNLYESQQFSDYIKIMRQWYSAGYMPKDMATSPSNATEYMAAGRLFSTMAGYGGAEIHVTVGMATGKNIGSKWVAPFYFDSSAMSLATVIASTTKVPEAAMKMMNILYTDAFVTNTILYGIEGTDYVKVDEHHWKYPEGKDGNTVAYTAAYSTGIMGSEKLQLQPQGMNYDDVLLKLRQNREVKHSPYFGFVFDASPVTSELAALANVYSQYIPGLVCGSLDPDTAIPQFNAALKSAGIDRVIQAKQTQLDAWISANK